jgi:hypothetical protein
MYFYVTLSKVRRPAAARSCVRMPGDTPPPSGLSPHRGSRPVPTPGAPPRPRLLQRLLRDHDEVQLSALGTAVSTMVSVAEILKKQGFVTERGEARAGSPTHY